MGRVTVEETLDALRRNLQWTAWTDAQLSEYSELAVGFGVNAQLHIEVDVGMSRFGAAPADVPRLLRIAREKQGLEIVGLTAHFPSADIADPNPTLAQNTIFEELLINLNKENLRPRLVHAANSAAALRFPAARYDMVRVGMMLYGETPFDEIHFPIKLVPALTWKTELLDIRTLAADSGVGYGGEYVATAEQRIGVIGIGYAYGFRRTPKNVNQVLVRGKLVAVLGRVCMQQCMIDLDPVPEAKVGDEVVLLGEQLDAAISANDLAERWRTNRWDILCGISPLLPRKFSS
jgi:alanine racemase